MKFLNLLTKKAISSGTPILLLVFLGFRVASGRRFGTVRSVVSFTQSIIFGARSASMIFVQLIYNSTNVECLMMLRMMRAPFFALCNYLCKEDLF
jgi:hypothetical protein